MGSVWGVSTGGQSSVVTSLVDGDGSSKSARGSGSGNLGIGEDR